MLAARLAGRSAWRFGGQQHFHTQPATATQAGPDAPAMGADDVLGDGQAQAMAVRAVLAKIRVAHPGHVALLQLVALLRWQ